MQSINDRKNIEHIINEKNKMLRYIDIIHSYYVYLIYKYVQYISVSGIIKNLFPIFDENKISSNLANKTYGKYKNKSKGEILIIWDNSRKDGTLMHLLFEMYLNNDKNYDFKSNKFYNSKEFYQFKLFLKDHSHFIFIKSELKCYSNKLCIAGTIDVLFFDTIKKIFVIIDFKRVQEIKLVGYCSCNSKYVSINQIDNNYKHGNDCELFGNSLSTQFIINCNFEKYSIQLNLYGIILNEYNINEYELYILNFYESNPYQKINVMVNEKLIKNIFPGCL